jgi:3-dehydroquinate dehydratase-2
MKILVLNGPNINFLGIREKGIYGTQNYETLAAMIEKKAAELGVEAEVFQSNYEGGLIDKIQEAYFNGTDGIVINPGAFTHYSYAVRDALASVEIPKIEVHISNVHKREEFRHVSVTAPVCTGQVVGLGLNGYLYAMEELAALNKKDKV